MCLIVEIIMTILGIVTLVRGEAKVIGKNPVRGWPAYIIGGLLTATLPFAVAIGFIIGIFMAISGQAVDVRAHMPLFTALEASIVVGNLLICIVLSLFFAKEPPPPGYPPQSTGFPQYPFRDSSFPQKPSPPMDPANPYAPPPDTGPNYPYQKYRRYRGRS